jgi:Uma2 family endonuclease
VSAERIAATVQSPEGYFPGPPDLAVEVVSPFDTYTEVEEKVAEWLEAGTRVVVVVDPRRRTAAVHRSRAGIEVLGAKGSLTIPDLLPGWSAALAEIFK